MTNPRCPTCKGRGYKNEALSATLRDQARFAGGAMEICDDVYQGGAKRGQPCTPRTVFSRHEPIRGNTRFSNRDLQLASDKRREVRELKRQQKLQAAG